MSSNDHIFYKIPFVEENMNEENNNVLFVFYNMGSGIRNWLYGTLPGGWRWTGAGSTSPFGGTVTMEYTHEEQFNGPNETQQVMNEFLESKFQKLLLGDSVSKYKICNSYLP